MVDGTRLTFGFEGTWQGTAVLYDHETGSLWMHLTGECFAGRYAGTVLARLPTGRHTTWADWRAAHPETDVLRPEPRLMDLAADLGYFTREGARSGSPHVPVDFLPTMLHRDGRLQRNELVYGIVVGAHARAYPFAHLTASSGVVEERVGGTDVTVWFDRASRSAAAFARGAHRFEPAGPGRVRDAATGSFWNLEGACVEGGLEGEQLAPLHGLMAEWYGWSAHHPDTTVWPGDVEKGG